MDWHRCNHLNDRIIWYWKKKLDLVNQLNGWKQLTPKNNLSIEYILFALREIMFTVVHHVCCFSFTNSFHNRSCWYCYMQQYRILNKAIAVYISTQPSGEFYQSCFTVFTTYWSVIKIGVILLRTWKIFCIIVRKM